MKTLRERIAEDAENWLKRYVPEYISQQTDLGAGSPEEFIQVKQSHRLQKKRQVSFNPDELSQWNELSFTRKGIRAAVEETPKLVILGDPGLGKTTSLYHITHLYAEDMQKPLPLYLPLKLYRQEQNRIEGLIRNRLSKLRITPKEIEGKPLIFLLDGFNELKLTEQDELLTDIEYLQTKYPKTRLIITSRKIAYPRGLEDWSTCELLELDKKRIKWYIKQTLGEKQGEKTWRKIQQQHILDIARVPLLLNFICELAQDKYTHQALPLTKGELLREIVCHRYSEFTLKKSTAHVVAVLQDITLKECLKSVSHLAHYVFEQTGHISFNEELLETVLGKSQKTIELLKELGFIETHIIRDKRNLTCTIYSFWHQSLFEYFAGYYLHTLFQDRKKELLQVALPYFEFYKWKQPMVIAMGLSSQEIANSLFQIVLEKNILLALKYLPVVKSRLSPNLKKMLENQLEKLLFSWHDNGRKSLIDSLGSISCFQSLPQLIHCLKDRNENIREAAILALDNIGNSVVIHHIIPMLKDENSDVRKAAAETLGKINNSIAVPHLISLLEDNSDFVRWKVAKALKVINDPMLVPLLISQLEHKNNNVRKESIDILGEIGSSEAIQPLIQRLGDDDPEICWKSAKALGKIGNLTTIPLLIQKLEDKHESRNMRCAAALALGRIGAATAIKPLTRKLTDDDYLVRKTAVSALGMIGNSTTVESIIKCLRDSNCEVRLATIIALAEIGSSEAVKWLIQMLFLFECRSVRQVANEALRKIGDTTAIAPLSYYLSITRGSINFYERKAVIDTLVEIGGSRAVPPLIWLLSDKGDDYLLRGQAAQALGKIGDPGAVNQLVRCLKDDSSCVRAASIEALGEIGTPSAIEPLLPLIENSNADMCGFAALALGKIGVSQAIQPLIKELCNDDPYMREAAANTLGNIGDTQAIQPLTRLFKDKDRLVYHAAAKALGKILARIPEESWSEELKKIIKHLAKKAAKDEKTFEIFKTIRYEVERWFVWLGRVDEEEKLEISFEKGKIKVGSKVESTRQQPIKLFEYFINKREEVHWIESIKIFDEWRKIRERTEKDKGIYNLKLKFEGIIAKLRGPRGFFCKNKLDHLKISNSGNGFYGLNGLENYNSNILEAEDLYKEAFSDYQNNDFYGAIDKTRKGLKIYSGHIPTLELLIRLLPRIEVEKVLKDSARRVLKEKIIFLKKSIETTEYYMSQLENKDWCNGWEDEKAREEFENEIGVFYSDLESEREDLEESYNNLEKYLTGKEISFKSDIEYAEIKELINKQDFDGLRKRAAIKTILFLISKSLYNWKYAPLKERISQTGQSSLWKRELKAMKKEAEDRLIEILFDPEKAKTLDFSKAATLKEFKNYLIIKANMMIREELEESTMTSVEKRHLREFKSIKRKLKKEMEDNGIYREPTEEECFDRFKEAKKVGSEYCEYIKELQARKYKWRYTT